MTRILFRLFGARKLYVCTYVIEELQLIKKVYYGNLATYDDAAQMHMC